MYICRFWYIRYSYAAISIRRQNSTRGMNISKHNPVLSRWDFNVYIVQKSALFFKLITETDGDDQVYRQVKLCCSPSNMPHEKNLSKKIKTFNSPSDVRHLEPNKPFTSGIISRNLLKSVIPLSRSRNNATYVCLSLNTPYALPAAPKTPPAQ